MTADTTYASATANPTARNTRRIAISVETTASAFSAFSCPLCNAERAFAIDASTTRVRGCEEDASTPLRAAVVEPVLVVLVSLPLLLLLLTMKKRGGPGGRDESFSCCTCCSALACEADDTPPFVVTSSPSLRSSSTTPSLVVVADSPLARQLAVRFTAVYAAAPDVRLFTFFVVVVVVVVVVYLDRRM